MLVGVVANIGDRRARAGHQHLGDAVQRIADFTEEFVLRPDGAAVLRGVVGVRPDLVRLRRGEMAWA